MTKEKIAAAIDKIAPDKDAEKRMYENILKKAECTGSKFKAIRIIKPAVSTAACVCLVAAAAVFLHMQVNNTGSFSGSDMESAVFDGVGNDVAVVLTTTLPGFIPNEEEIEFEACETAAAANGAEEGQEKFADYMNGNSYEEPNSESESEPEKVLTGTVISESAELIFNIPEGAQNVFDSGTANMQTGEFIFGEHCYSFSVSEPEEDSGIVLINEDNLTEKEAILNYSEVNAVLYSFESEGTVAYKVCWENGEHMFSLINSDGADKKDLINIFAKAVEIN